MQRMLPTTSSKRGEEAASAESPKLGPTSRPTSGDGSKSMGDRLTRRRKPSIGLATAVQVAPFALQRSLSQRLPRRPSTDERNEDSQDDGRLRRTSFGGSGRWGSSRAEERPSVDLAAFSNRRAEPKPKPDPEP